MTKYVRTTESHTPGKAITYRVGIVEPGRPGLTMQQTFRTLRQKKRAEEYAAWLRHLLDLEATAKAAREVAKHCGNGGAEPEVLNAAQHR